LVGFERRRINTELLVLKFRDSERPGNVSVLLKKYPQACEEVSDVTDTWFQLVSRAILTGKAAINRLWFLLKPNSQSFTYNNDHVNVKYTFKLMKWLVKKN